MKYAVLAITAGAVRLGEELAKQLEADFFPCKKIFKQTLTKVWQEYEGIVCIMATGIIVRTIAPLIQDKQSDPAVVVCDEKGQFAISLLSGHLGGANELAHKVAKITKGQPVITTASDVLGKTALDIWCRENGLQYSNKKLFTQAMGKLVDTGSLAICSQYALANLPADFTLTDEPEQADLIITSKITSYVNKLHLYPRSLIVGIGCKRDTPAKAIQKAILSACKENDLAPQAIAALASITLKKDEQGLLEYAQENNSPLFFFTSEELNNVPGIEASSPTVQRITGAKAVAEPAALLAAGTTNLLVGKIKHPAVTTAIAEITNPFTNREL